MAKLKPWLVCLLVSLAPLAVAPAAKSSWHPDFQAWRAATRADPARAGAHEQDLFERHWPVFPLPPGHAGLGDFYRHYVATAHRAGSRVVVPCLLSAGRGGWIKIGG